MHSAKRRRVQNKGRGQDAIEPVAVKSSSDDALEPATKQDQANWKGFCEIESEPVSLILSGDDTFRFTPDPCLGHG